MADLLALSRAAIDEGKGTKELGPINRINHELSEIGDGVAHGRGVFALRAVQDR